MSQQQIVSRSGTTELRVESMTYTWEIKNVDQLANPKIRSVYKVKSPTFKAGTCQGMVKEWHLELSHTKNDWMKCTLVQDGLESQETVGTTGRGILLPSIITQGVNMTPSQMMEKLTGSFVHSTNVIKNDGSSETLQELMEKSEQIDGWTIWASKFCEKRRKMGCVEFLFGENNDCAVNAIPIDYLWDKRQDYALNNSIRLQVELLFTYDLATHPCQTSHSNSELLQAKHDKVAMEKLGRFHNNHLFSDLKLKCGNRTFPCHKLLLATRAENFVNCLLARKNRNCGEHSGDATSSSPTEAVKLDTVDTILVEDLKPEQLEILLQFIYKETIPEETSTQTLSNLSHTAKLYQMDFLTHYIDSMIMKPAS